MKRVAQHHAFEGFFALVVATHPLYGERSGFVGFGLGFRV